MKKRAVLNDLTLSPVMLGTVQFGMQYGIANRSGQPTYETAKKIIETVYDEGINCFDTAAAYGTSEEVLGKAFSELGISGKVVVTTKIPRVPADLAKRSEIDDFIEKQVLRSMRRLQMPYLSVCLFHVEEDFRCVESLLKLQTKGLVRHLGCSVANPEAADEIISTGIPEAIQLPANLLDHRFRKANLLVKARRSGCAAFVRSVFLQGLILMPESEIKSRFDEAKPVLAQLRNIAYEAGMSLSELALRYVLTLDGCTCAVVGLEAMQQVETIVQAYGKGPLEKDLVARVEAVGPELPDEILVPSLWHK